jgi:23S rRNA (uracil1939-C5)-methyltransferase
MVNIVTAFDHHQILQPLAERLLEKYPQVVSVINNITSRKAGVSFGEMELVLSGTETIVEKIGAFVFEISANSFFQTNTAGAAQLYAIVKKYAELTGSETVTDLYSGTGTISILLAEAAKEVVGIEMVSSAVADARRNCRINGVENCRFLLGDIHRSLPEISHRPDLLIIDPPRAGIHPDVVKHVLVLAPERIIYVSCNPATLARDLSLLQAVYRVQEVQPVDLFPHTYHIESVAKLQKIQI